MADAATKWWSRPVMMYAFGAVVYFAAMPVVLGFYYAFAVYAIYMAIPKTVRFVSHWRTPPQLNPDPVNMAGAFLVAFIAAVLAVVWLDELTVRKAAEAFVWTLVCAGLFYLVLNHWWGMRRNEYLIEELQWIAARDDTRTT